MGGRLQASLGLVHTTPGRPLPGVCRVGVVKSGPRIGGGARGEPI